MSLEERLEQTKRPETEEKVQAFFSSVAKRYDIANSLISLGTHYGWKRRAVAEVDPQPGDRCIDVCTGTNDVAIMLARAIGPKGRVTGIDWNQDMLNAGQFKVEKFGLEDRITNRHGDAEDLPVESNTFNRATVAVASRHLNIDKHFQEMYRVLKPGGRAVCLDFFEPPNPVFRRLYNFYSYAIMPKVAALATKDKTGVYDYLPDSIRVYYKPDEFAKEMKNAGFKNVKHYPISWGICYIFAGDK